MRNTDYAFCVARIRANEKKLLTDSFINKLVDCESYIQTVDMLTESGWIEADDGSISDFVKAQNEKLWKFLSESVPDKNMLNGLCIQNDFFNIKTAVKCLLTGESADKFYVHPTSLNLDKLSATLENREFDIFGNKPVGTAVKSAYELACKTGNGQNAEIIIDNAAIKMLAEYSEKYKNTVFSDICALIADTSNIKTAFRCVNTEKNSDFINSAISVCCHIDRDRLISVTLDGIDALYRYLSAGRYAGAVELYLNNPVHFEKWCDDKITELSRNSKFRAFGFDPICAYYYAKLNEIKTIRTILYAKQSGVSSDILRERVKASYV